MQLPVSLRQPAQFHAPVRRRCCPSPPSPPCCAWAWACISASRVPPDYQQGTTVTIMFIHVPAAIVAEGGLWRRSRCASLLSLVWRHPLADIAARAAAPLGALFTALGLVTGSLWGKPMWGTYWVWDARLTSFLLLLFLYLGYMALWNAIEDETRAARAAAILALVGAVNLPIIDFSVDWWSTLHQGESIISGKLAPVFLWPLLLMMAGYMLSVLHPLDDPHPHRHPGAPRAHPDAGGRMNFWTWAPMAPISGRPMASAALGLAGAVSGRLAPIARAKARLKELEAEKAVNRLIFILPVLGFRACWRSFCSAACGLPAPDILPSALIDKPAPPVGAGRRWTRRRQASPSADLRAGHVTVVNIFASWCVPCRMESAQLMTLSKMPGVALYGLTMKDRAGRRARLPERAGQSLWPHRRRRCTAARHRLGRLWRAGDLCGGRQGRHPLQICRAADATGCAGAAASARHRKARLAS